MTVDKDVAVPVSEMGKHVLVRHSEIRFVTRVINRKAKQVKSDFCPELRFGKPGFETSFRWETIEDQNDHLCKPKTFNHECLATANIYGFSHQTSQFVTQPAWQNLDQRVIMKTCLVGCKISCCNTVGKVVKLLGCRIDGSLITFDYYLTRILDLSEPWTLLLLMEPSHRGLSQNEIGGGVSAGVVVQSLILSPKVPLVEGNRSHHPALTLKNPSQFCFPTTAVMMKTWYALRVHPRAWPGTWVAS